jgi:hypothetical protein
MYSTHPFLRNAYTIPADKLTNLKAIYEQDTPHLKNGNGPVFLRNVFVYTPLQVIQIFEYILQGHYNAV